MKALIKITITHCDGIDVKTFKNVDNARKFFKEYMGYDMPSYSKYIHEVTLVGGVITVEFLEGINVTRKEWVEKQAENTNGMKNHEIAKFHLHNTNGLVVKATVLYQKLEYLIDDNIIDDEALIDYSFDTQLRVIKRIAELPKFNVTKSMLDMWIKMMEAAIDDLQKFIDIYSDD